MAPSLSGVVGKADDTAALRDDKVLSQQQLIGPELALTGPAVAVRGE